MPTIKRQKYLDRLAAKQINNRTQEERQVEYDKFMSQFAQFGLSTEFEEIDKFATMANDWVTTGTVYQGSIPIMGINRDLVYMLTNNKKNDVVVMLKSTDTQTTQDSNKSIQSPGPTLKRTVTKKRPAKPANAQSA